MGGNSAKRRAALDVGRTYAPKHILANATAEIKQGMRQCSHVLCLPAELSLASLTLQAAHLRAFPLLSPHMCTRLLEWDLLVEFVPPPAASSHRQCAENNLHVFRSGRRCRW